MEEEVLRQHEGDGRIRSAQGLDDATGRPEPGAAAADGDRRGEGEYADAVEGVEGFMERRLTVVLGGPRRDGDEHVRETWWLDGVRHPRTFPADDRKPNAAAASGSRRWAQCCP